MREKEFCSSDECESTCVCVLSIPYLKFLGPEAFQSSLQILENVHRFNWLSISNGKI